jgi:hypothetical protein
LLDYSCKKNQIRNWIQLKKNQLPLFSPSMLQQNCCFCSKDQAGGSSDRRSDAGFMLQRSVIGIAL